MNSRGPIPERPRAFLGVLVVVRVHLGDDEVPASPPLHVGEEIPHVPQLQLDLRRELARGEEGDLDEIVKPGEDLARPLREGEQPFPRQVQAAVDLAAEEVDAEHDQGDGRIPGPETDGVAPDRGEPCLRDGSDREKDEERCGGQEVDHVPQVRDAARDVLEVADHRETGDDRPDHRGHPELDAGQSREEEDEPNHRRHDEGRDLVAGDARGPDPRSR